MDERDRYAGFWQRFVALIIDYHIVMLALFPFFIVGGLIFPNSVLVDDPYGLFSTERVLEKSRDTLEDGGGFLAEREEQIVEKTVLGHWVYLYKDIEEDFGHKSESSRQLIDPQTREEIDLISYEDLILIALLFYWATMESGRHRASYGKRIIGIEVVDAQGAALSWPRAFGRNAGKFLSAMICCIGFMMAGWTNRKQGLHDMIAGCVLVARP